MFKRKRKSKAGLVGFLLYLILLIGLVILGNKYIHFKAMPKTSLVISPYVQTIPLADKIKATLTKDDIEFTDVVASDSSYLVILKDGSQVVLPGDYNVEAKAISLQVILKQFTIEGKRFKQIDFRFDKPTILF